MKNNIFVMFIGAALSCHAHAHMPSLFYTQKEQQEIQTNRQKSRKSPPLSPTSTSDFHLSGLLYSGPDKWKIWINTKPYNKKNFPGLEVIHITPFEVSFIYTHGTRRTFFTLTPNARRVLAQTISP